MMREMDSFGRPILTHAELLRRDGKLTIGVCPCPVTQQEIRRMRPDPRRVRFVGGCWSFALRMEGEEAVAELGGATLRGPATDETIAEWEGRAKRAAAWASEVHDG